LARLRGLARGASVAVLVGVLALVPSAAQAQARTFHDRSHDTSWVDLTRIHVSYAKRLELVIHHRQEPVDFRTGFDIWIDTDAKNRGPEYRYSFIPDSDASFFDHVDGWRKLGADTGCYGVNGVLVRIPGYGAPTTKPVRVSFPARCLGKPHHARVAIRTQNTDGDRTSIDWAPKRRTFFGWVERS
jgi:hypothetical protein